MTPFGFFDRLGDVLREHENAETMFWAELRPTGYAKLDESIGGFRSGELIVVTGQPGSFLEELNLQFIESVAVTLNLPVAHALAGKSVRSLAGAWMFRHQSCRYRGSWSRNRDKPDLTKLQAIIDSPIYVRDFTGLDLYQLTGNLQSLAKGFERMGLIVIDGIKYINRWHGSSEELPEARWADVSFELKALAKATNCPVIVTSWLYPRKDDRPVIEVPTMRNLPHEGALACSADLVLALDCPQHNVSGEPALLNVVYSRHGLYGSVELQFESQTRWLEYCPSCPVT